MTVSMTLTKITYLFAKFVKCISPRLSLEWGPEGFIVKMHLRLKYPLYYFCLFCMNTAFTVMKNMELSNKIVKYLPLC